MSHGNASFCNKIKVKFNNKVAKDITILLINS